MEEFAFHELHPPADTDHPNAIVANRTNDTADERAMSGKRLVAGVIRVIVSINHVSAVTAIHRIGPEIRREVLVREKRASVYDRDDDAGSAGLKVPSLRRVNCVQPPHQAAGVIGIVRRGAEGLNNPIRLDILNQTALLQ